MSAKVTQTRQNRPAIRSKLGSRWLYFNMVEIDIRLHPLDVYVSSLQCIIYPQSNGKSEENDGKIKEIKTIGEDTINLKSSELLSSSSVIVWTCTHTIRGRTI